mmetsp:Transcript_23031/g.41590  ORF Transcript_23031/g.41590 Transcript_23031/m.41590 type:complete len:263 (+) Transcript_23031:58-846(+)|eukprot:CAMPEP_0197665236 /NCGR_PEP_ID=MMETSP1338-20131121/59109_1 /TAXON_ID=43686 ORGANISM="Pelagodinium beii, Strain RCC1491" /NCGR_SAMPLE_ID=MMETSP1338 /ASSEMBLY_ACC=CAM_ASM_000754 /LENGTH=262 /DNA_ID=CAMNT_0043244009 /DNA_START=53 /DNA_END=841 /DNA_ORIENTATION=-
MPHIEGIYVTPHSAASIKPLQTARLVAGRGIEGDRYSACQGTYSLTFLNEPGRQLTMISADGVEAQIAASGLEPLLPEALRRNIVIRGIGKDEMNKLVGHEVLVGKCCRIFVHRLCVPCKYNESLNKRPCLMEKLWDVSGINCEVLLGGEVSVGDSLSVVPDSHQPERIKHGKPDAFFVQPSKRTAEQRQALAMTSEKSAQFFAKDGPGSERLELAYRSAGVRFFASEALETYQKSRRARSLFLITGSAAVILIAVALARKA